MTGTTPAATTKPSGATAVTAAVLALLGGILNLLLNGGIVVVSFVDDDWSVFTFSLSMFVVVGVVAAVGLIVGAVMLLRRHRVGRIVIAASCGMFLLGLLASAALPMEPTGTDTAQSFGLNPAQAIRALVLPTVTAILALVPATARWCAAAPGRR